MSTLRTYQVEIQTLNGTWQACGKLQTWNGAQWVRNAYASEQEARDAAETAYPDRYPEGASNATFRIVCTGTLGSEARSTRVIKPENWIALGESLREVLCFPGAPDVHFHLCAMVSNGHPPAHCIEQIQALLNLCTQRTYNGMERARALSCLESLRNYGLIAL